MTHTTVTATVHIRLTTEHGHARPPHPTHEHGGITPVPAGCCVLLDVGDAHHISGPAPASSPGHCAPPTTSTSSAPTPPPSRASDPPSTAPSSRTTVDH
ncbi:hypothetical protein [Nocardiopsis sp. CNR-923]|uniref:hypothetical protein n=1 Tax=Nocardiopsis sp. CNR-923 TaxID=1904965 RepID=UPI00118087DA|nr:hypothetical protein [Nocardiopsis sp. CNR-923]